MSHVVIFTPINEKYRRTMNMALKYYRAYHVAVNKEDQCETLRETELNEREQAVKYTLYEIQYGKLTKREQKTFNKQHRAEFGYV